MTLLARRRMIATIVAMLMVALATSSVAAATFYSDQDFTLEAGETTEGNVYAFGSNVTIDGTVTGDLVATGEKVVIGPSGVVEGDLMAAGGEVLVDGTVQGDARIAGYRAAIGVGGSVGGELLGAGYSVEVMEEARVAGEMRVGGYQVIVDGTVDGDAIVGSGAMRLSGEIGGDLRAWVDNSEEAQTPMVFPWPGQPSVETTLSPGLDIQDTARIGGDLEYMRPEGVTVDIPDVVAGSIEARTQEDVQREMEASGAEIDLAGDAEPAQPERGPLVNYLIGVAKGFGALLIVGLIAYWLIPGWLSAAADRIGDEGVPSAGWGFLAHAGAGLGLALLLPITIVVFMILGLLQLAGTMWWAVFSASFLTGSVFLFGFSLLRWVGRVAFALWIGRWIAGRMSSQTRPAGWLLVLGGSLIYMIAARLPIIGFWLDVIAVIVAVGALLREWFARRGGTGEFGHPEPAPSPTM